MQMKLARRTALSIVFCATAAATVAEPAAEPRALVKIDDFTVNSVHFALFAGQTGRNPQDQNQQLVLLNELVNNFMVANSPQGRELADNPEVAAALEVSRARLLAQAYIQSELQKTPVDEERIRALYDAEYGGDNATRTEYKARHMLLKTEAEARAVIGELDAGADFASLAGERSIGPSKSAGGDLGWFEAGDMVPTFSAATAELANGTYTKDPVETQFGWHVILREENRDAPPPSFDSVRQRFERQIQQEHVAKLLGEIREQSNIEIQESEAQESAPQDPIPED